MINHTLGPKRRLQSQHEKSEKKSLLFVTVMEEKRGDDQEGWRRWRRAESVAGGRAGMQSIAG